MPKDAGFRHLDAANREIENARAQFAADDENSGGGDDLQRQVNALQRTVNAHSTRIASIEEATLELARRVKVLEGDDSVPLPPPSGGGLEPIDPSATQAHITVHAGERQEFAGHGWSVHHSFTDVPRFQRAGEMLFGNMGHVVRFWIHSPDLPAMVRAYVDSGFVELCRKHNVKYYLAAFSAYDGPRHAADRVVNQTQWLKDHGLPINMVGPVNEPGSGNRPDVPRDEMVPFYQRMRAGLPDTVDLIGLEYASNDDNPKQFFDELESADALNTVVAGAHHSYNMAGDPGLYDQRWMTVGKPIAQTEAGDGGVPSSACRFINDLTYGSRWHIFHQALAANPDDPTQKLVDHTGQPNRWYHQLRAIADAVVPGTVMRLCTWDGNHMVWTYGRKPKLHACAGRRPDGRWAIAVINGTRPGQSSWPPTSWHPPERIQVTVTVEETGRQIRRTLDSAELAVEVV